MRRAREISTAALIFPRRLTTGRRTERGEAAASALQPDTVEGPMRVYEVMSKKVETVKPTVRASEARNRMRQSKIHHLVVTEGSRVTGVVSDRDLGGSKLPSSLGQWTVEDFMTTPVVTVTTRTLVRRAAALMRGRSIGSLVVTSANGKLAGIVTVSDLLDHLAQKPERVSNRAIRKARKEEGWDED
jgi:CBS domain-containing protein